MSGNDVTAPLIAQEGVASALEDLMGAEQVVDPGDAYCIAFLEGSSVDAKIKQRIWDGAYINLSTLLPRIDLDFHFNTPAVNAKNVQPNAVNQARQPPTIMEWLEMFQMFAAIYCEKYGDAGGCIVWLC